MYIYEMKNKQMWKLETTNNWIILVTIPYYKKKNFSTFSQIRIFITFEEKSIRTILFIIQRKIILEKSKLSTIKIEILCFKIRINCCVIFFYKVIAVIGNSSLLLVQLCPTLYKLPNILFRYHPKVRHVNTDP